MQMKGQAAIPSTTIIELSSQTAVFPRSSPCIPLSYIFHEIFISSCEEGYFLSSFTQLTWMPWKTLLTRYCHVSSDESCALMKKQFSWDQGTWPFKCEQMTAHLFLFTSWCLNPTLLLHQWLTHITAALGWGLQVWMTPQGNRFTGCCYARSI